MNHTHSSQQCYRCLKAWTLENFSKSLRAVQDTCQTTWPKMWLTSNQPHRNRKCSQKNSKRSVQSPATVRLCAVKKQPIIWTITRRRTQARLCLLQPNSALNSAETRSTSSNQFRSVEVKLHTTMTHHRKSPAQAIWCKARLRPPRLTSTDVEQKSWSMATITPHKQETPNLK